MYIRKSIRSYKGATYTNYVLVESVHTAKGPRQRAICSLGDLSPRPALDVLESYLPGRSAQRAPGSRRAPAHVESSSTFLPYSRH